MNAREELYEKLKGRSSVKCATIKFDRYYSDEDAKVFNLKIGYGLDEWHNFISSLNFEYDDGYGSQELYGIIWLEDDSWLERSEYDGSEWWKYCACPEIPNELR